MPALDNAQHELFAQQIAKGSSQRDAYKAAGYKVKSDAAADANASRLLSTDKVSARVRELQEFISERTVEKSAVSKAWVIAKLVENVERAMQGEAVLDAQGTPTGEWKYNGNVANRALELIGKEQGMFVDRKEVGSPGDFDQMSEDELSAAIAEQTRELAEMDPAFAAQLKVKRATKH